MGTITKTAVAFCVLVLLIPVVKVFGLTILMVLSSPTFLLMALLFIVSILPIMIMMKFIELSVAVLILATQEFKKL